MGILVPLFWLRTFYVKFRWSPDEVHLESRYIEYKYANSSIFQVDFRWTPDGYWSPAGVHLNSVGECKVLELVSITYILWSTISEFALMQLFCPAVRENKQKRVESDAGGSISSQCSKKNSSESPYRFWKVRPGGEEKESGNGLIHAIQCTGPQAK
jgi:hypothetical protein